MNLLLDFYIKRQFARDRDYQEVIMRRRLGDYLQKVDLARYYRQDCRVGDDRYHVILPFVHFEDNAPRKVIKPLHLDKPAPTEIYRHGDAWIATVRRLRQINCLPKEFLFAVRYPNAEGKRQAAAAEVCRELQQSDTLTIPFGETERILKFAQCQPLGTDLKGGVTEGNEGNTGGRIPRREVAVSPGPGAGRGKAPSRCRPHGGRMVHLDGGFEGAELEAPSCVRCSRGRN